MFNGKIKVSVGATSKKQVAELLNTAFNGKKMTTNEVSNYFSDCWGNNMNDIELTEPCVYDCSHNPPKRII